MKVKVAYGKSGIDVEIPDSLRVDIFKPKSIKGLENPIGAVKSSIKNPIGAPALREIVKEKCTHVKKEEIKACIVISDHTRPIPSKYILPPVIEELLDSGLLKENISILVATGLHRKSTMEELKNILGEKILKNYKVIIHEANDDESLVHLGTSSRGTPIYLNQHYVRADIKILTGYVDPHFFAGYAGGRKSVVPGIAGTKTILENHSARNIDHPRARFIFIKDNPIHEDALEIANLVGVDFIINVCLNEKHEIIKVASGGLEKAHGELVKFMNDFVAREIASPYDIVVVNNGGYPLDLNLYQAVKSMSIGEMAVKKGGTIIATNELSDGFGPNVFKEIIEKEGNPERLIAKLKSKELITESQWQVQILARILLKAEILVVSSMPTKSFENIKLGLKGMKNFKEAMNHAINKHGNDATILILPAGPQLIPVQRK
ncbi:MAG: nickel-dependent lactate racemase [Promethearchaeota archaeon]